MRRVLGTAIALLAATLAAEVIVVVWAASAVTTMPGGPPAGALGFWHHRTLTGYFTLAGSATGNGVELFGVLAVIYMLALLVDGIRRRNARYRAQLHAEWLAAQQDQDRQDQQQGEEWT